MLGPARPLSIDDLLDPAPRPVGPPAIAAMRQTHHELARLVAEGRKDVEISAITGYSQNRISVLKASPAFAELVTHYATIKEEVYVDTHKKIATLGNEVLDVLREDLHDGVLTPSQKLTLAAMALDRSGHGPQSRQTNINFNAPLAGEALAAIAAQVPQKGRISHIADVIDNIPATRGAEVLPPPAPGDEVQGG